jgi:hypothetical protein
VQDEGNVISGSAAVRHPASPEAARIVRKDGPMDATLSLLGAVSLVLAGVVVVLGAVILILYEARWILRLGRQLTNGLAERPGPAGETAQARDERGGA